MQALYMVLAIVTAGVAAFSMYAGSALIFIFYVAAMVVGAGGIVFQIWGSVILKEHAQDYTLNSLKGDYDE